MIREGGGGVTWCVRQMKDGIEAFAKLARVPSRLLPHRLENFPDSLPERGGSKEREG